MTTSVAVCCTLVSLAGVIDLVWVVAFRRGRFSAWLGNVYWKEWYLQRVLLGTPSVALGAIGLCGVVVVAVHHGGKVPVGVALVGLAGVICLGLGVIGFLWFLGAAILGRGLPMWFLPAWARDSIRAERRARVARRPSLRRRTRAATPRTFTTRGPRA